MCYDADVFNPLTFIEEAEREINVKDICAPVKIFRDHNVITDHARDHCRDHPFWRDKLM